jgi:hypothetical protein
MELSGISIQNEIGSELARNWQVFQKQMIEAMGGDGKKG